MNHKDTAINYLWHKAKSDREKGLMSLGLLMDHPAGIGDHSTEDFYKNLDEALNLLVDADDRLEALKKYFVEETDEY
tara:strand:+ start:982 stop:1212 length:231 start_codon:yes stop_codon:yes gene_type:complete